MRISREADYAIRIILYLCLLPEGTKVDARTIAENQDVPLRFALKILRKLNIAGLTKSFRGMYGGYQIIKTPEEISFKDVIEAAEGPICLNRCLSDPDYCPRSLVGGKSCPVHDTLGELQAAISGHFERATFAQLINEKV